MKKMFMELTLKVKTAVAKVKGTLSQPRGVTHILANQRGEGYVDTAVVILIAVVVGALLLGALYALFGDIVIPKLQQAITDMFDYAG